MYITIRYVYYIDTIYLVSYIYCILSIIYTVYLVSYILYT